MPQDQGGLVVSKAFKKLVLCYTWSYHSLFPGSHCSSSHKLYPPVSLELVLEEGDRLTFQAANPRRQKTGAWSRYESYKVATTVGQARESGATSEDLRHDTQRGFATVAPALGRPRQAVGAPGIVAGALVAPEIAEHEEVKLVERGEIIEIQERAQALEKELAASKVNEDRLQSTISELQRQVEELQKLQRQRGPPGIAARGSEPEGPEREASGIAAEAFQNGCQPFLRMALRAFEYSMDKYTLSEEQLQKKQSTRAWLEWMAGHVSPELVRDCEPQVLAALLLHTAWCMEWGEGLPWSKFLTKLVHLTRNGNEARQQMQTGFPFQVMRFLQLSAEDCKHLGFLHAKFLMMLPSSERKGVPGV